MSIEIVLRRRGGCGVKIGRGILIEGDNFEQGVQVVDIDEEDVIAVVVEVAEGRLLNGDYRGVLVGFGESDGGEGEDIGAFETDGEKLTRGNGVGDDGTVEDEVDESGTFCLVAQQDVDTIDFGSRMGCAEWRKDLGIERIARHKGQNGRRNDPCGDLSGGTFGSPHGPPLLPASRGLGRRSPKPDGSFIGA